MKGGDELTARIARNPQSTHDTPDKRDGAGITSQYGRSLHQQITSQPFGYMNLPLGSLISHQKTGTMQPNSTCHLKQRFEYSARASARLAWTWDDGFVAFTLQCVPLTHPHRIVPSKRKSIASRIRETDKHCHIMKPQPKGLHTDRYSIRGYHDCRPAFLYASEPIHHHPSLHRHRPHRVHHSLELMRARSLLGGSDIWRMASRPQPQPGEFWAGANWLSTSRSSRNCYLAFEMTKV